MRALLLRPNVCRPWSTETKAVFTNEHRKVSFISNLLGFFYRADGLYNAGLAYFFSPM